MQLEANVQIGRSADNPLGFLQSIISFCHCGCSSRNLAQGGLARLSRTVELSPCDSQSDKESLFEVKAHMLGTPAILTWVQAFEELRIIYGPSLAIVIALP